MNNNDKKIMDFLGYKTHKHKDLNCLQWDCPKNTPLENVIKGRLYSTKLHFKNDWNWLIPVLQKISTIHNKTENFILSKWLICGDIEKVYNEVLLLIDDINFIKKIQEE